MARIRSIKPDFPQSESMGRVGREARLCFILLWTLADDDGRLRGSSRMLASLLYPYDDDAPAKIGGWLAELVREQCIRQYDVGSDRYIEVCKWLKHQKIDRPTASKLPKFDEGSLPTREESRGVPVGSGSGSGSGKEKPSRANGALGVSTFAAFWHVYPRKVSKDDAEKVWAKLSPSRDLVERIVSAVTRAATCDDWVRDGGRFVPYPATWLRGKRWEDRVGDSDLPAGLL